MRENWLEMKRDSGDVKNPNRYMKRGGLEPGLILTFLVLSF